MTKADPAARTGTQSISRAISLLREIAARPQVGWQLADLAMRCNMGRSTAHRILACLVREGMVLQRPSDRHYLPGTLLFELGLSLPEFGDLQHAARTRLATLANRTGASAFLHFRSGDEFVCAVSLCAPGVKATTLFPGARRPLIMSAGGVAILLALPVPEARATIRRNFDALKELSRARRKAIRAMLYQTHEQGFAINAGALTPGMNGYAIALRDSKGTPVASIVVVGTEQLLPLQKLSLIRRSLQEAAEDLQEYLK